MDDPERNDGWCHPPEEATAEPWLRRHWREALLVGGIIGISVLFLLSTTAWRPLVSHAWHAKAQVVEHLERKAEGSNFELIRIDVSERGGTLDLEATYWRTLPSVGRHHGVAQFEYSKDRRAISNLNQSRTDKRDD